MERNHYQSSKTIFIASQTLFSEEKAKLFLFKVICIPGSSTSPLANLSKLSTRTKPREGGNGCRCHRSLSARFCLVWAPGQQAQKDDLRWWQEWAKQGNKNEDGADVWWPFWPIYETGDLRTTLRPEVVGWINVKALCYDYIPVCTGCS